MNEGTFLLEHVVVLGSNRYKSFLEQEVHSVENQTGGVRGVSSTLELHNIWLFDTVDGRFGSFKRGQSSSKLFICLFFFNGDGVLLLHASFCDGIDLLGLDVGFLVLNVECFKKFSCSIDSALKNDVFLLEVNLKFFDTSSCFCEFVETLVDVLLFHIDALVLKFVYVLVHGDE